MVNVETIFQREMRMNGCDISSFISTHVLRILAKCGRLNSEMNAYYEILENIFTGIQWIKRTQQQILPLRVRIYRSINVLSLAKKLNKKIDNKYKRTTIKKAQSIGNYVICISLCNNYKDSYVHNCTTLNKAIFLRLYMHKKSELNGNESSM
jgi:hypothetical protein